MTADLPVSTFSERIARMLAVHFPDRFVATMSKVKRRSRIFIDHFRNRRGNTTVVAYSTRARAGATVSAPESWRELEEGFEPEVFNMRYQSGRLRRLGRDSWQGFFKTRQFLTRRILAAADKMIST